MNPQEIDARAAALCGPGWDGLDERDRYGWRKMARVQMERPDLVLPVEALVRWLREQEPTEALFIIRVNGKVRLASTHGTVDSIRDLASSALESVAHVRSEAETETLDKIAARALSRQ